MVSDPLHEQPPRWADAVLRMLLMGAGVMLAIWHDPETLQEWRNSGGLDEAFLVVPVIMVAVGAVMGTAGALLAKCVSWPARRVRGA